MNEQQLNEISARWQVVPVGEQYRLTIADTSAPGITLNALLNAHADVLALLARIAELEASRPSRFSATPFQVDAFMRTVLAEDTYLRYQQAIGSEAVREAMGDAQSYRNCDDNAQMKQAWRSGIDDALGYIDPDGDGGPYPSQLLCSQHSGGFGPCPGAPKCIPNRDGVS